VLVDTHCHIHEPDYPLSASDVLEGAKKAGVEQMICVGTSEQSSKQAVEFANANDGVFASIGVHPHDAKDGWKDLANSQRLDSNSKIVAVGEIGLDFYYDNSPREVQTKVLREQIEFALSLDLPIIFHVRDAFDEFWKVFDSYQGIRGEIHSFTDDAKNLEKALDRGLYIGINGISTFTKDDAQVNTYKSVPLDKILLETDSPFLTPVPFRGKVNQPAFVKQVAEHHAKLKGISLEELATATTLNAQALFAL